MLLPKQLDIHICEQNIYCPNVVNLFLKYFDKLGSMVYALRLIPLNIYEAIRGMCTTRDHVQVLAWVIPST
jgi:hypothetical protein